MPQSRKTNFPLRNTMRLTTYSELERFVDAFRQGHLRSVLLLGPPGIGKSQTVRQALGDHAGWICGNASPFGIYLHAYEHRNRPLVLDDIDELNRSPAGVRLLKALCQTDAVRTVSWQSAAQSLERYEVPRQFETSSPIILIANEWASLSLNVQAAEDRLQIFAFEPTVFEIHQQAGRWFDDDEVFAFIGAHLAFIQDLSFRTYVRIAELKRAGFDWRELLLRQVLSGAAAAVARLKADLSFPTEEARARAFVSEGHGCRATYYNHARRLMTIATAATTERLRPATDPPRRLRLRGR